MGKYEEIYATLSPEQKKQSDRLKERLSDLGVSEGMQARLQCMSRFGEEGNVVWQGIYYLATNRYKASQIRDKGSWLMTFMRNPRL